MLFKNIVPYRLPENCAVQAQDLEIKLSRDPLQACGGLQMESRGWTHPHEDEANLFQLQQQWLLCLGVEQKLLPSSIIRQHTEDRAAHIALRQGHSVGRKQLRDLKEQVTGELLPRALARRRLTHAWIDRAHGWLMVDAAADTRAEQFMEVLRRAEDDLSATRVETQRSPAACMAAWLAEGNAPNGFSIDQDLELRAADHSRATVRYSRHSLEGEEIRGHLAGGKTVVRLGLTWNEKISFVLTEHLQIKRVVFLDILRRESDAELDDPHAQFAVDFALMSGELARMFADLMTALGGEKAPA